MPFPCFESLAGLNFPGNPGVTCFDRKSVGRAFRHAFATYLSSRCLRSDTSYCSLLVRLSLAFSFRFRCCGLVVTSVIVLSFRFSLAVSCILARLYEVIVAVIAFAFS